MAPGSIASSSLQLRPGLLPVERIEPGFGKLISVCCELPLCSGSLDNFFMTAEGRLVIVEVKLWRNPEARRRVVAQALDYAAAIFQMSYESLQEAVVNARKKSGLPGTKLHEIVGSEAEGLDESKLIDAVNLNLERGRAFIAVVGDGIREDTKALANLVQSHAGHRFTFALVEMTVYEKPDSELRIIVPSVLLSSVIRKRSFLIRGRV